MPPRQPTLHMYLDNDAPHQTALRGIYALARLRSPLAEQVRTRARRFIAVSMQPGGSVTYPIVLDHAKEDDDSVLTTSVPIELECPICRTHLQTPLVFVFPNGASCLIPFQTELWAQFLSCSCPHYSH